MHMCINLTQCEIIFRRKSRIAKKCPIDNCGRAVIALPRHLRNYHFYSREESLLYREATDKTNDRPYKTCPVPGCTFRTKRLDKHLVRGKEHKDLSTEKRKFYRKLASKAEKQRKHAQRKVCYWIIWNFIKLLYPIMDVDSQKKGHVNKSSVSHCHHCWRHISCSFEWYYINVHTWWESTDKLQTLKVLNDRFW